MVPAAVNLATNGSHLYGTTIPIEKRGLNQVRQIQLKAIRIMK